MKASAQVIIVGAGPVGSVAAYRLAKAGIDVILLESEPECPEDLRASTFHPPTLDMMDELGVFEDLDAQGLRAPVYQYRDRQSGENFSFDLSELADVMKFPFRLQCEQFKLARLLSEKTENHACGRVFFDQRVVAVEEDATGVMVDAEDSNGERSRYRANWLVGCDGAGSTVRKWLGTQFDGFTYPEKFVTYSTKVPIESHLENLALVNYVADPDEWMVLLKVPSVWRVLVPAGEGEDDYIVSDECKRGVFNRLIGDPDVKTEHRTIYRVHQRVAKSYFRGRVVIAGDAAHLNNPLGGFGMNSGIHDVWNLTERLMRVEAGKANPEGELAHYQRQRQAVMRAFVQKQTIKNKRQLENNDDAGREAYRQQLRQILANEERRRAYLLDQSMYHTLEQERAVA